MGRPSPGPFVRSLRPLVLEHVAACRLPSQTITEPPRPGCPAPSSLPLLPELSAIVGHSFFRGKLIAVLEKQVCAVRCCAMLCDAVRCCAVLCCVVNTAHHHRHDHSTTCPQALLTSPTH
jgi:hypothetical protein